MKTKTLFLSLTAGVFLGPLAASATDTAFKISACDFSQRTIIGQNEGVILGTSQVNAHVKSDAFGNGGYACQSVWTVGGKGVEFTSLCRLTDGEGNDTFSRVVGANDKLTFTFLGGSGKYVGISGGGAGVITERFPGTNPSLGAFCWEGEGTYNLPG